MRDMLVSELRADDDLEALVGGRIYESSSLGAAGNPVDPKRPYLVYKELPSTISQEVKGKGALRFFQFSCYDDVGSFLRIGEVLKLVGDTCKRIAGRRSPSGVQVAHVIEQGESADLVVEQENANMRSLTVRFVVSR